MLPDTLTKQPSEVEPFNFDFTGRLPAGVSITGVTSILHSPPGLTITNIVFSGLIAQCLVAGGSHNINYGLKCLVTTSIAGGISELDGRIIVFDVS